MTNDPDFLTVEDVLLLHEEQLLAYGGGAGVRDRGALESAVAMPRATFDGLFVHDDLFAMASAYAFTSRRISHSSTGTNARGSRQRSYF